MSNSSESIKVFEYDTLTTSKARRKSEQRISQTEYDSFLSYYDANPKTPFFSLINNGVKFNQYVGAIQIGETTIEVLPKAGRNNDPVIWQGVLIDMLKTCHLLQARQAGSAQLRLKSNSILELYYELFIIEVEQLMRRGLIKKYKRTSGQQLTLKGALDFNRQITKNLVHKERFYTRHTIYTRNHLLHQLLNEALIVLRQVVTSPALVDRIKRLQSTFPVVTRLRVNASMFDGIPLSRKRKTYQTALSIAKLIVLNYRPDIKAGKKDLLAIMFDMNRLWEEYVLRMLKKYNDGTWKIKGQEYQLFWERKGIKPDIVLRKQDKTYVIDTKWKMPENRKPQDADLKQMYVYNHHWEAQESMLLYPSNSFGNDIWSDGKYTLPNLDGQTHRCRMGYVEVLDGNGLNKHLASQILELIDDKNRNI